MCSFDPRKMTNTEWISALQRGEPGAYAQLYEQHWKSMYKQALGRVEDDQVAQDIVQDVFVSLWQKRERLVISVSMEAFLAGCVKLQVLAYFKKEKVRLRVIEKAMQQMEILLDTEVLPQAEMDRSLQRALKGMPENMRQSFLLRCDNRSIREIADILGIAEQTVSNNLNEVVKRLRKKIDHQPPGEYMTCLGILLSLYYN